MFVSSTLSFPHPVSEVLRDNHKVLRQPHSSWKCSSFPPLSSESSFLNLHLDAISCQQQLFCIFPSDTLVKTEAKEPYSTWVFPKFSFQGNNIVPSFTSSFFNLPLTKWFNITHSLFCCYVPRYSWFCPSIPVPFIHQGIRFYLFMWTISFHGSLAWNSPGWYTLLSGKATPDGRRHYHFNMWNTTQTTVLHS